MRVFMLGWEFPPAVSGGLGTACLGLTRALAESGTDIIFVLPRCGDGDAWSKVEVVGLPVADGSIGATAPEQQHVSPATQPATQPIPQPARSSESEHATEADSSGSDVCSQLPVFPGVEFVAVEARLWPYRRPDVERSPVALEQRHRLRGAPTDFSAGRNQVIPLPSDVPVESPRRVVRMPEQHRVDDDVFREVDRYTEAALHTATERTFDVVHAHDWMTYPAARAIAQMSGKPFIAHVHSTEFDRSGHDIDQRIYDIERAGLDRADLVIAVSHMTRGILMSRYGVPAERIIVVYNAIATNGQALRHVTPPTIASDEKIVLFLGRITMQKGPEYFLAAARKVLQVYDSVRFVMAGAGDAIRETMDLAHDMGIADKVVFTGFLRGDDVERIFRSADLYVMPSVSDPFGIAALEAISYDVPVLMSKQSGAAEVLRHVLKVDFWNIEEMANKIVAVLRHPPLQATLKKQAGFEVRRLTWSDAAARCRDAYETALEIANSTGDSSTARPISR